MLCEPHDRSWPHFFPVVYSGSLTELLCNELIHVYFLGYITFGPKFILYLFTSIGQNGRFILYSLPYETLDD